MPQLEVERITKKAHQILTLSKDSSVLIQQQHDIRDLSSDGRHVVRVEVILDGLVNGKVFVDQNAGNHHKDNVEGHDGLLEDLEDNDAGRSGGVHSGTNQDQTDQDSHHGIGDNVESVGKKSHLEHTHVLRDGVHGLFGLLPLDEDPADGNGGVNHAHDGNGLEDTSSQSGSSKTASTLFHESNALLVDSLLVGHLNKLLVSHGVCIVLLCGTILWSTAQSRM